MWVPLFSFLQGFGSAAGPDAPHRPRPLRGGVPGLRPGGLRPPSRPVLFLVQRMLQRHKGPLHILPGRVMILLVMLRLGVSSSASAASSVGVVKCSP